jgi:hypothetical protein
MDWWARGSNRRARATKLFQGGSGRDIGAIREPGRSPGEGAPEILAPLD